MCLVLFGTETTGFDARCANPTCCVTVSDLEGGVPESKDEQGREAQVERKS